MSYRISDAERALLYGLPHLQQLIYLVGLRPFMDYSTGIVGIKRGISYRSLQETLFVEAHQGRLASMPGREQIRRAIKNLSKAGLIELQSNREKLILKCISADQDFSVSKKADRGSTPSNDILVQDKLSNKSVSFIKKNEKADNPKIQKPDTPPVSGKDNINTHTLSVDSQSIISLNYQPSATLIDKAKLMQYDNVICPLELERFIAYHRSKGTRSYDWDAEYFYWVLNYKRKQGVKKNDRPNYKSNATAVERVARANQHHFKNVTFYQTSDHHTERHCLPVDIDDTSIWSQVSE